MSKREIIRQFSISAEIYELDLALKILEAIKEDMPTLGKDLVFGLDIVFNKDVYQKAEFFQYPITKEHKGPKPKTQQEKTKQIIYDVLSEQLDVVTAAMKELGFCFGHTAIIGEELVNNEIVVALYEEKPVEMPKGKKQTHFRVNSIIPDRPYVMDQAAKSCSGREKITTPGRAKTTNFGRIKTTNLSEKSVANPCLNCRFRPRSYYLREQGKRSLLAGKPFPVSAPGSCRL